MYVAEAGSVDSAGQKRSNDTHESTTDPDARLYKNSYGEESHLAYLGHALVENRNGLIAQAKAHREFTLQISELLDRWDLNAFMAA